MEKHRWTLEEDYTCCYYFLFLAFCKKHEMSASEIVKYVADYLPEIDEGSVRMKLQNIKQLSIEFRLYNDLPIKPLTKYSKQCEKTFLMAMKELDLEVLFFTNSIAEIEINN